MSRHSPYLVGGACTAWVLVHERAALPGLLADWSGQKPTFTMFGTGTNSVYRDGASSLKVCRLGQEFTQDVVTDGCIELGAALPIEVARYRVSLQGVRALDNAKGGTLGGWIGRMSPEELRNHSSEVVALEVVSSRGYKWVDTQTIKKVPKVVTSIRLAPLTQLEKSSTEFMLRPQSSMWFVGPGTSHQKQEMIRRIAMDGARLRGVLMPKAYPDHLVCLGKGTAHDYWELHRSVLDRIKRFHGVTWRCD